MRRVNSRLTNIACSSSLAELPSDYRPVRPQPSQWKQRSELTSSCSGLLLFWLMTRFSQSTISRYFPLLPSHPTMPYHPRRYRGISLSMGPQWQSLASGKRMTSTCNVPSPTFTPSWKRLLSLSYKLLPSSRSPYLNNNSSLRPPSATTSSLPSLPSLPLSFFTFFYFLSFLSFLSFFYFFYFFQLLSFFCLCLWPRYQGVCCSSSDDGGGGRAMGCPPMRKRSSSSLLSSWCGTMVCPKLKCSMIYYKTERLPPPSRSSYAHNKLQMSSEDHYSRPHALAATLFRDELGDIELPENSNVLPHRPPPATHAKYQEELDDDFLDINLGIQSHIAPKLASPSTASSTTAPSTTTPSNTASPTQVSRSKPAQSRVQRRGKKGEAQTKQPVKEVDIDGEIGQIAEWAERGARGNSDDDDFEQDNAEKAETAEQAEIRRKLEEKLRVGFGEKKQGGLLAKAEQLRKLNEQKQSTQQAEPQKRQEGKEMEKEREKEKEKEREKEREQKAKPPEAGLKGLSAEQQVQHNRSSAQLGKGRTQQSEDGVEEHWNRINQQTINQLVVNQQKRSQMTLPSVIAYYQKEFTFEQADVDEDAVGQVQPEEEEEVGCMAALCACFREQRRKVERGVEMGVARRLVAISKRHLGGGEEEFFLLREVWTRLTGKEFSRYGGHWNEIGFQGRDPATDLRSTGVLSLLQWVQFIDSHPKLADKYYSWSVEHEFPLALAFIKLTAAFLDLLARGDISASDWTGFQRCFNCLAWGMMGQVMGEWEGGALGSLVQDNAKQVKRDFKKLLSSYYSQFKLPR